MKPLAMLAAAAFALTPTAAPAAITVFNADLRGGAENPPVVTGGSGFGIVTIDDVMNTMRVQMSFTGLEGLTTASHIHCCTLPTGNAGVATELPSFTGFPLGVSGGTYDRTFDMTLASNYNPAFITVNGGTVDSARAALFGGMLSGLAYLNIHSTFSPRGEIRGQLNAVPEPGTWLLMLAGFGMVGWTLRRQRSADALAAASR